MARKSHVEIPHSRMKEQIADVLKRHFYINKIEVKKDGVKKTLVLELSYQDDKTPKFNDVTIVSSPGKRVYISYKKLPEVLAGLGITIVSTPEGVMSGSLARKKKIGGEFICKIW